MDVDSPFLQYFDTDSVNFPWRESRPAEIDQRRAMLGDLLLYDVLLQNGDIHEPDLIYPPRDVSGLHRLLEAIATSTYDDLKKDCLIYYLLKWHMDGRESRFQQERCIIPQFAKLADAYWCLDTGLNVAYAISLLSDCRLNTDYASKIMQAIISAPSTDPYPSYHPLIVKYIRTAKPLLTEPDDLDTYMISLATSSSTLTDAWQFQRSFSEQDPTRTRLLKRLLQWCVMPEPRPEALAHLLILPLSPFEKGVLHSYAASSPPKNPSDPTPSEFLSSSALGLAVFQNLACTRLVQTGDYADAIKLHRKFVASSLGSSAAVVNIISDRKALIESVYASLPAVERTLLDMELEGAPMSTLTTSGMGMGNIAMSSSWEDPKAPGPTPAVSVNGGPDSRRKSGIGAGLVNGIKPSSGSQLPSSTSNPLFGNSVLGSSTSTAAAPPIISSRMNTSIVGATRFDGLPILPATSSITTTMIPASSGFSTNSGPRKSISGLPAPGLGASSSFSSSTSAFNTNPLSFSSSSKKPNAFYKPPFAENSRVDNDDFNPFASEKTRARASGSISPERPEREKAVFQSQRERRRRELRSDEDEDDMQTDADQRMDTDDSPTGLDYSIFLKKGQNQTQTHDRDIELGNLDQGSGLGLGKRAFGASISSSKEPAGTRRSGGFGSSAVTGNGSLDTSMRLSTSGKLPGSFMDEDDEDDEENTVQEPETISAKSMPPPPVPEPKTRGLRTSPRKSTVGNSISASSGSGSVSAKASSSKKAATSASAVSGTGTSKVRKSTRKSTAVDSREQLKRSIPGAMFDEDEDESDVQSEVASDAGQEEEDDVAPLRNTSARRNLRKTGSGIKEKMETDEGVSTRRRSTRLSSASNLGDAGTKKSTRSAGKRKK
ncbi:hypothetical protein D9758_011455 [Tetrapyrgos nigripes]|uniref:ELYS-like domain-containing protein n=1 Tax=Tetrapyrgos nigripes TaxID=182062 RepID=A0A8H5CPZ0_9AGAR|nr:hypothetical protein D9758_011455 [Tetrapyrgos nigripes]